MKSFFLKNISRFVRLTLGILLIYASMVFYLALSERRLAFPRAIPHKEARDAISANTHIQALTCLLADSISLEGWYLKQESRPTLLYFPDAEEDAAQFIAEMLPVQHVQILTFNYRGSGENKGTADKENILPDAVRIAQCAESITPNLIYAGRGSGAILAAKTKPTAAPLLLIDPVESIADKIADKYKLFFPKFLARSDIALEPSDLTKDNAFSTQVLLLEDRTSAEISNQKFKQKFPAIPTRKRHGETLADLIDAAVIPE